MKNRTLAVILAISGILLGVAVYKTISEKAQQNEGINNPINFSGPEDDEDLFGLEED